MYLRLYISIILQESLKIRLGLYAFSEDGVYQAMNMYMDLVHGR